MRTHHDHMNDTPIDGKGLRLQDGWYSKELLQTFDSESELDVNRMADVLNERSEMKLRTIIEACEGKIRFYGLKKIAHAAHLS